MKSTGYKILKRQLTVKYPQEGIIVNTIIARYNMEGAILIQKFVIIINNLKIN